MTVPASGDPVASNERCQTDFKQKLRYSCTGSTDQIRQDLAWLKARIDQQRREKRRYVWIIVISGIACALSFPLLASPVSFLPLVISVGVLVFAGYQRSRAPVYLRYRLEVCRHVIDLVQRDLETTDLQVNLDLGHPCKQKQPVQRVPVQGSNMTRDFFEDSWLDVQGQFLDGTQFALGATEFLVRKHGTKLSRSGKTKHKSKVKSKGLEVALVLQIPRKRYGAVDVLQRDAADALQLPPGVGLKSLKIKQNQLQTVVKLPPIDLPTAIADQPEPSQITTAGLLSHTIGSLFLGSYHILNLAHKLSKPTTSA